MRDHGTPFAALAAMFLTLAIALGWSLKEHPGAVVRHLDPELRADIYARTLSNAEALCRGPSRAMLRPACRYEMDFLRQFPECDEHCRSLVVSEPVRPR